MISTPPPFPSSTPVPPVPTEPSGSMVTTVATTELVTEESTKTGPMTGDSTPPGLVSDNLESIAVAPTPTEEPADNTTPTDPVSADNSNNNDNGGSRSQTTIIAVVVVAIVMLVVLSILVSVLIGIMLFKKRTKDFAITRTNLHMGIANQLYGTN